MRFILQLNPIKDVPLSRDDANLQNDPDFTISDEDDNSSEASESSENTFEELQVETPYSTNDPLIFRFWLKLICSGVSIHGFRNTLR